MDKINALRKIAQRASDEKNHLATRSLYDHSGNIILFVGLLGPFLLEEDEGSSTVYFCDVLTAAGSQLIPAIGDSMRSLSAAISFCREHVYRTVRESEFSIYAENGEEYLQGASSF